MKHIYLIRHAQSESNAGISIRPNADICLTAYGQQQAQDLAEWLVQHIEQPKQIFISKYIRTAQTAQPYLTQIGRGAQILDDLFEFNYLDFQRIAHLTYAQLRVEAEQFWLKNDIYYQDGATTDSFAQFIQRVKNVRKVFDELDDGIYVVFTHGMWLGMLMWQILQANESKIINMHQFGQFELAVRPQNCEVFLLDYTNQHTATMAKVRALQQQIDNVGEPNIKFPQSTTK